MRQHTGISGTTWNRSSITPNYQENATYDGNGNILTYGRNGAAPTAQTIDSLTYNYTHDAHGKLTTNKLQYIQDAVANSNYTGDITNQTSTTNYRYDAIGDLIYDAQSGITGNDGVNAITWSVYGKIQSIYKTSGTISYTYDPAGQRVSKTAGGLTTYYVRDAQGNSLAVYDNAHSTINWKEQQLYGSSRLGLWKPDAALTANNAIAIWDTTGNKQYELDNHLGNVLETISDKRLQHTINGTSVDYYLADISTAQDYYPFGMLMPGRQSSTANYRYGFNGKENDNDVKGVGNQIDYGNRIYDSRVGRFLSVDPMTKQYPMLSSYQFASNSPIANIDMDGLEASNSTEDQAKKALLGAPIINKAAEEAVRDNMDKRAFDANNTTGRDVIPKLNPFTLNGALIAVWYLFTSPNDHKSPTEVYKEMPHAQNDNTNLPVFDEEMSRQNHFSKIPINSNDLKDENDEKKEYYIHYTNRKNIVGIATSRVILPSNKNKIYLTKAFLTEKQVETILFIGDPSKKGYGKYMTVFKVNPDQSSNIHPVPGNDLEYVHEGGSLRIRTGNLLYIGPNVKPQ